MTAKRCRGGRVHADALALVEFVFEHGGHLAAIELTNDEIARRLDWMQSHGRGQFSIDGARFNNARRHAMDGTDDDGHACTGYRLNYRRAGKSSVLALLDPSGQVAEHAIQAMGSVLGWTTRTRQHQTENGRIVEQLNALGEHALNNGDKYGHRLCIQAQLEVEEYSTLRTHTLGALQEWIGSIS